MYAFNHDEAIRSFKRAVELDEDCAMAWWGASLAAGPQYNHPVMTEERTATAWQAMQNALARLDNTTPLERALIEALKHRNVRVEPEDRTQQNAAYARAMARIWKANPDDSDIGALYAESMMIRRPWKLYSVIDQKPHKDTPHILSTLERVLEMDPTIREPSISTFTQSNPARLPSEAWRLPTVSATSCPAVDTCCTCLRTFTLRPDTGKKPSSRMSQPCMPTRSIDGSHRFSEHSTCT
jgi:hypothetical protein